MQTETVSNGKSTMLDDLKAKRHPKSGIIADRINGAITRASAKQYGVAFDDDWDDEQVAVALYAFFYKKKQQAGAEMFTCDYKIGGCGGGLINEDGPCPFCGFEEDETEEAGASASEAEAPADDDAPLSRPQPISDTEQAPPAETTPEERASGGKVSDLDEHFAQTSPVAPRAKPPKGRTAVKATKPPRAVEGVEPMAVAGSSTGLAKVFPTAMVVRDDTKKASEVFTEHDLDESLTKIQDAQEQTSLWWWTEGMQLSRIFQHKLWTLRVDKATKAPLYKTYDQFIAAELKLSKSYVYKRHDWSRAFASLTDAQAKQIGRTNLSLFTYAPKEEQPKLLQGALNKIASGEVHRIHTKDTRAKVLAANKKKGVIETAGSKTGTRKAGGGRKKEFAKIAIADYVGKATLAFYTLQDDEKGVKIEEVPKAVENWLAKVLPWATHESLDGEVTERFSLVVKDGKLKLSIERTRASDDAE